MANEIVFDNGEWDAAIMRHGYARQRRYFTDPEFTESGPMFGPINVRVVHHQQIDLGHVAAFRSRGARAYAGAMNAEPTGPPSRVLCQGQKVGLVHVAAAASVKYELFVADAGGKMDFDSPAETFAALPHTTTAIPASTIRDMTVRKTNRFGLSSLDVTKNRFETDGAGDLVTAPPSPPNSFFASAGSGVQIRAAAAYSFARDGDNQADEFIVFASVDPAVPDPAIDVAVATVTMDKAQISGVALLDVSFGSYSDGQRVNVVVVTNRSADSSMSVNRSTKSGIVSSAVPDAAPIQGSGDLFLPAHIES